MSRQRPSPKARRTNLRRTGASPVQFESLEPRLLLSGDLPSITRIEADNRGLVVLTASKDLDATTINANSVKLYLAGADGRLNTADDVQAGLSSVGYDNTTHKISFLASGVPANQRYKVVLDSSIIKGANGVALDGEFNGGNAVSGDGKAGGDMVFFTTTPASKVVRMDTTAGTIDLQMLADVAPKTVSNFLTYADSGLYDKSFFHRSVNNFVVQGGGFEAAPGFQEFPTNPPVENEFNVSNTRGTVAMAKRGNDPNSATDQFFFNLGNNSANLDSQNGGFTVFAKVIGNDGLSVMDALAQYTTVDASSANSAFNEIPVVDEVAFLQRGSQLETSDLVRINRAALLVDVAGAPAQQLDTKTQITITAPTGGAAVTVFDLNGTLSQQQLKDSVKVAFGAAGKIGSISLVKDFDGSIGISITGATSVNLISDARKGNPKGTIGFIVDQSGSITTVSLRGAVTGYNLNGYSLPNSFLLPDDIDGNGASDDPVAILTDAASGRIESLTISGSLNGDVVARGGLKTVKVTGATNNANFVSGGTLTSSPLTFILGAVDNSSISSQSAITSLSVANWLNSLGNPQAIAAPSIGTLATRGGAGLKGDFEVDVGISAQGLPTNTSKALGSATIVGSIYDSNWSINGYIGAINVRDNHRWTLEVARSATTISMGQSMASSITVTGTMNTLTATNWFTGDISIGSMNAFNIVKSGGSDGSFTGNFTITNDTNVTTSLNTATIAGDMNGGIIKVSGAANSVTVVGTSTSSQFNFASISKLLLGVVNTTTVAINKTAALISAVSWNGGTFQGGSYERIVTTGRGNARGDLTADFKNINVILKLETQRAGNMTSTFSVNAIQTLTVAGDLVNSKLSLTNASNSADIETFTVRGAMTNSELRSASEISSASIGRLVDSGIYSGVPASTVGLPTKAPNYGAHSGIGTITIGSLRGGTAMSNSFIVAKTLSNVSIFHPQIDNGGKAFGVAASSIGKITTTFSASRPASATSPSASLPAVGDYQVNILT